MRTRGLTDISSDQEVLKDLIVRVGAPDYEASPEVLPFTLEEKCRQYVKKRKID
jgi:hypothetical protein